MRKALPACVRFLRSRFLVLRNERFQYISAPVVASSGSASPANAQTIFTPNPQGVPKCKGACNQIAQSPRLRLTP